MNKDKALFIRVTEQQRAAIAAAAAAQGRSISNFMLYLAQDYLYPKAAARARSKNGRFKAHKPRSRRKA